MQRFCLPHFFFIIFHLCVYSTVDSACVSQPMTSDLGLSVSAIVLLDSALLSVDKSLLFIVLSVISLVSFIDFMHIFIPFTVMQFNFPYNVWVLYLMKY
jgi:hypothetical protein